MHRLTRFLLPLPTLAALAAVAVYLAAGFEALTVFGLAALAVLLQVQYARLAGLAGTVLTAAGVIERSNRDTARLNDRLRQVLNDTQAHGEPRR